MVYLISYIIYFVGAMVALWMIGERNKGNENVEQPIVAIIISLSWFAVLLMIIQDVYYFIKHKFK